MNIFIRNTCNKIVFSALKNNNIYCKITPIELKKLSEMEVNLVSEKNDVCLSIGFDRIDNNNIYLSIFEIDNFA